MHPKLSFEQAPPISVPFRFFLTAPLFGIAAGLLLTLKGGEGWATRWNADVLAFTHLLSAGFMLQTMCGALLQFIPVATGGNIWQPRWVAHVIHPLMTLAAMLLVSAFILPDRDLFLPAGSLFLAGLLPFILISGWAMWHTPAQGATLPTLRLALAGLFMTLLAGLILTLILGGQLTTGTFPGLPLPTLANIHAGWGMGGWALLLVMGVSYLVVPMFQLTPAYPLLAARLLPLSLLAVLLFWTILPFFYDSPGMPWAGFTGLAVASIYAGITLHLQKRRRRRVTDVTLLYWRIAMASLLAVFVSWLVLQLLPSLGQHPRALLWPGVLVFMGVFVSAISGMIYKIVPFLIWLHWQQLGQMKTLPPNMKQIISEKNMRGQLAAHLVALALLLAMQVWPSLARLAGLAMILSFAWLEWNLVRSVRLYLDFRRRVLDTRVLDESARPVSSADRTDADGERRVP